MPKVEYQIEIKKTGEGAAQATADLKQVGAAAAAAQTQVGAMTQTLATQTTHAATKTREAGRAIHDAFRVIAFTTFPQAAIAGEAVKVSFNAVRASALALSIPVGAVAAGLAGITAIVLAGREALRAYRAQLDELATSGNAFAASASTRLSAVDQLKGLGGFITPELQAKLMGQLGPRGEGESDDAFRQRVHAAALRVADANRMRAEADRGAGLRGQAQGIAAGFERSGLSGIEAEVRAAEDAFDQAKARLAELGRSGIDITREMGRLEVEFDNQIQNLQDKKNSQKMFEEIQTRKQLELEEEHRKKLEEQSAELVRQAQLENERNSLMGDLQRIGAEAEEQFASGLSAAIVGAFSDGEKSFQKFFATFMQGIAQMILQAIILRSIQGIFGASEGGTFFAAQGGTFPRFMAMGGIQTVSRPTYFRDFNVVAGEAGAEMLTVLNSPRMMEIGGIQAAVGNAAGNRLAITSADALERGSPSRSSAEILIRLSQGLEAAIVQNSIAGARVRIVRDLTEDSDASKAVKRLVS